MRILFATVVILFGIRAINAQPIKFDVHFDTTAIKIIIEPNGIHTSTVIYQMPVWAPGAYSVTNYGRFVHDFKALDSNGKEISTRKMDENRWVMNDAKKLWRITYNIVNSFRDSTSLYFAMCQIDTNFAFANGTALFGYFNDKKNVPFTVQYYTHFKWTLYTPLTPIDSTDLFPYEGPSDAFHVIEFHAKNYDELADAPVMAGKDTQFRSFEQGGAMYDIALASDQPFPMDSLEEYTKKIVKSETDFFGDTPFKRYVFLINAPTFSKSVSQGFGALEHANSSAYLLVNVDWSFFKQIGLATISHEFFHLWNVKRIHSNKLGPFDYTKRVMTTSLWLSEGVTDYYANALLSRSGIMKPNYFEGKIAEWYAEAKNSKAVKTETLEQLSIDESNFDLGKAVSFYSKGPLVAMMLDIEIRTRTSNKKSLDDVMRTLYAEAKKGKYFKDEELIGKIEKISGLDLQDFYHRYVAGTDSLPLATYLPKMGLIKDYKEETSSGVSFRTHYAKDSTYLIIEDFATSHVTKWIRNQGVNHDSTIKKEFDQKSDLELAGLMKGDTILTINGKPMNRDDADEFSLNHSAPVTIEIEVARNGERFKKSVTLTQPRNLDRHTRNVAPNKDATPAELAIRKAIYGG